MKYSYDKKCACFSKCVNIYLIVNHYGVKGLIVKAELFVHLKWKNKLHVPNKTE